MFMHIHNQDYIKKILLDKFIYDATPKEERSMESTLKHHINLTLMMFIKHKEKEAAIKDIRAQYELFGGRKVEPIDVKILEQIKKTPPEELKNFGNLSQSTELEEFAPKQKPSTSTQSEFNPDQLLDTDYATDEQLENLGILSQSAELEEEEELPAPPKQFAKDLELAHERRAVERAHQEELEMGEKVAHLFSEDYDPDITKTEAEETTVKSDIPQTTRNEAKATKANEPTTTPGRIERFLNALGAWGRYIRNEDDNLKK